MFNALKSLAGDTKDKAVSMAIEKTVNYKIQEFGKMLKFNLDSKNKKMSLEIMLDGEKEELHVEVNNYMIHEEDEKSYLVAENITTSRAWINTVAAQYLSGQKFEIPTEYVKILKMVV